MNGNVPMSFACSAKAKVRRKKDVEEEEEEEDEEEDEELMDKHSCQKCGQHDHPEWILLCDKCDMGWHCSCLRPPLFLIPEGDWFCPPCEHKKREIEIDRRKQLIIEGAQELALQE
ncbi:hypothetical protein J437_LFUL011199, partial [Ladona fulva]